jgi:hypothetical protein
MAETKQSWRVEQTMNKEELKKAFFVDTMEIRNDTNTPILAKIVKVKATGNIFIYIVDDRGYTVKPHSYRLVPIEEAEF